MNVIGIDTSNYTTSIAFFDGTGGVNCSKLLPVKLGELGLRQSDAVFAHIKSLPELSGRLFSDIQAKNIGAVGVSTRPRAVEGSYMPCFLVGVSHAKLLADVFGVPLVEVSHQQGHIASSLWSAGRLDIMDGPHLAWHLSGGTTELLLVEPEGKNVTCTKLGGTTDISAGQLIDRTGQLLGLSFPSGKQLDELSRQAERCIPCEMRRMQLFPFRGAEQGAAVPGTAFKSPGNRGLRPSLCGRGSISRHGTGTEAIPGIAGGVLRRGGLQFHAAPGDAAS